MDITRHAKTWTITGNPVNGTYANGDPWVVGPITITAISDTSTDIAGRIQHGSMINPSMPDAYINLTQGYDNQLGGSFPIPYDAALNVGRPGGLDLSVGNPLVISTSCSLISSTTNDIAYSRPQLEAASVLTIVNSAPVEGSFRPPYSGTDKTHSWNISDIRWDLLPAIDKSSIANLPTLSAIEDFIKGVWLQHAGGTSATREINPSNNLTDSYNGDCTRDLGDISLTLMLDYTQAELTDLMYSFLQIGIDLFGITSSSDCVDYCGSQGGLWMGGGHHGTGRKWPMMFAGLMLNDPAISAYCDPDNYVMFQEEQQFFYVSQADVDQARYTVDGRPRDPYTVDMIGLAEWGEQHTNAPERDGSNISAAYRMQVAPSLWGHGLSAALMGQETAWNWPSFFDYLDRHYDNDYPKSYYSVFAAEMWGSYRDSTPQPSGRAHCSDGIVDCVGGTVAAS